MQINRWKKSLKPTAKTRMALPKRLGGEISRLVMKMNNKYNKKEKVLQQLDILWENPEKAEIPTDDLGPH